MKLEIIVKTSILLVSSYHFGLHLQLIHFAVVRSFIRLYTEQSYNNNNNNDNHNKNAKNGIIIITKITTPRITRKNIPMQTNIYQIIMRASYK